MKKNRLGERVDTFDFGQSAESKALDKLLGKDESCPCDRHLSDFCANHQNFKLSTRESMVSMKHVIQGIDAAKISVHLRPRIIAEIQKAAGIM